MSDEPLSEYTIHELATRVDHGTATRDQGRTLLAEFVRWHEHGATPPPRLIEHVARCLAAYLNGQRRANPAHGAERVRSVAVRTLDQAFGLVRESRGQPRIDRDIRCQVAMSVLTGLVAGRSLESLKWDIAEHRRANGLPLSSDTQVAGAWRECKQDALGWLQALREIAGAAWTDAEMQRLRKIYRKLPGVLLPSITQSEARRAPPQNTKNTTT